MATTTLTKTQRDLLEAIAAGHITRQFSLRGADSWCLDDRSHRKVTSSIERLVHAGLAYIPPSRNMRSPVLIELTDQGREMLCA